MKNKIPTAESLLQAEDCALNDSYRTDYIVKKMKEFAKLHVEAALEEASKKAEAKNGPGEWSYLYVDENSIINSYPLTNII